MNKEFNNVINAFKNLSTEEKKEALIKEFKINLAAIIKLNNDINSNEDLLMNKEILDINNPNATLDDFLEAYFVYLCMISNSIASFAEKVSQDFYE